MAEETGDDVSSIKALCKKCGNDKLLIPEKDEDQIVCPKCNTSLGTKEEIRLLLLKEANKVADKAIKETFKNVGKETKGLKNIRFK